uniref:Retrovirus-related Pol polyprotein from transposon TNT 1-94 n=1 Tax=Tanacetum cinerariifolium TaxID=118510 RepID=A0A6L2NS37_TANCI|nr:retrovirus-related Pol polyprotein from transposon TNT 1-94 [Tanacetum cinerariifolium]
MHMVRDNSGNQFRRYAGQNVRNQNMYNAVHNAWNHVVQLAVHLDVQNIRNQNGLIVVLGIASQNVRFYNYRGMGHHARNYTVRPKRKDAAYLQTQLLDAQKEEAWIQLQAEEFDLMAAAWDIDEIEEVNSNCILMANLLGEQPILVGQFYDSDLEVAFRKNTCLVRNLEGVDLLKENRTTNLYTINLHEVASSSPICLITRATSTKSWLWHQRLSHLNFDTINDLAKNDLVTCLPKFKYHKNIFVLHVSKEKQKGI